MKQTDEKGKDRIPNMRLLVQREKWTHPRSHLNLRSVRFGKSYLSSHFQLGVQTQGKFKSGGRGGRAGRKISIINLDCWQVRSSIYILVAQFCAQISHSRMNNYKYFTDFVLSEF